MRSILALLVFTLFSHAALAANNKVMNQSDSPIQITAFASEFGGRENDYIIFEARYMNSSNRPVIGIKFGFVAYDLFNESLGGVNGLEIDRNGIKAGGVDSGQWRRQGRAGLRRRTRQASPSCVRSGSLTVNFGSQIKMN